MKRLLKPRVVLDTNIYISALALISQSSDKIISLARAGEVEIYISKPILLEFKRVLIEKFKYHEADANERLYLILRIAGIIEPKRNSQM